MKNKVIFLILVLAIIFLSAFIIFKIINSNNSNTVISKDTEIQNEQLIFDFMHKIDEFKKDFQDNNDYTFIELKIKQNNNNMVLKYYLGASDRRTPTSFISINYSSLLDDSNDFETNGYYVFYLNNEEIGKYDAFKYSLTINTEGNNKTLFLKRTDDFLTPHAIKDNDVVLLRYYAEYNPKFTIKFTSTNNDKVTELYDMGEYKIASLGGNATLIIDSKEYSFKEALDNNLISEQDIYDQLQSDSENGICDEQMYMDGGSTDYLYKDYTVLKLNTLSSPDDPGNHDLVIGNPGHDVISKYYKIIF